MGGGNAQKSATARARNLEKASEGKVRVSCSCNILSLRNLLCWFRKNAGGGAKGKEARMGGNMAAAMAEAQGVFFLYISLLIYF
jgi:hypothetical protein